MQNIDDVIIELPEYNEKIKQQFKARVNLLEIYL